MLQGYSQLIFEGALVTLELALSSVLLAVAIGLIGAGGKLSKTVCWLRCSAPIPR